MEKPSNGENDITEIFSIINQLRDNETQAKKQASERSNKISGRYFLICIATLLGSGLLGVINQVWIESTPVNFVSLVVFVVAYFGVALTPVVEVWLVRHQFWAQLTRPFEVLHQNVVEDALLDIPEVERLRTLSVHYLEYVKIQLEQQLNGISKRVGLLIGIIDRMGLFPGLLSIVIAHSKLAEDSNLGFAIAYSIPILHVGGIMLHTYIYRTEKVVAILGWIIEDKQDNAS